MQLEIFTDFGTFRKTFHTVLSWVVLGLLAAAIVWKTAYVTKINWSMGPFHPSHLSLTMPEEDFANLWTAGHLVRMGRLDWLYTSNLFQSWKQAQFGALLRSQDWIYPPTVLLIGVPMSFLPLVPAYLLWDAGTLLIAVGLLRHARLPWPVLLVGLLGPATWRSLILGQYGVITGALVVAGLLLAPGYPIRAGVMLGLSTVKPQQGVIVPVAWLAARYWRAMGAAAIMFGAMALAIVLWLGGHAWMLFFTHSNVMARGILDALPPQPNINTGTSVFWMCRTLGSNIATAYLAQISGALLAVVFVYRAWRIPDAEPMARMALTVCLSLMITPYGYTSDMVAYSIAVAAIVAKNHWRLRLVDVLLWLWPVYCALVTMLTGVLFTPFIIVIAAALAWKQMRPASSPFALHQAAPGQAAEM